MGEIVCLAPNRKALAFQVAAFLGERLGHRLFLRQGTEGILEAMPLGPQTELAVVSTAGLDQDVIRHAVCAAPCPVIVVPAGTESVERTWRRSMRNRRRIILCGSDGSHESEAAVAFARRIARSCKARVAVARVEERGAAGALLERAEEARSMMIAIGSDCVDPDEFDLGTSLTGTLVAHAQRPVMIVPRWTRRAASSLGSAAPALPTPGLWRGSLRPA